MKIIFIITLFFVASLAQDDTAAYMVEPQKTEEEPKLVMSEIKPKETEEEVVANKLEEKITEAVDDDKTKGLPVTIESTESIDITDDTRDASRIASGTNAIAGENLDYAHLTIIFQNQLQTCGGFLIHPQFVATTASCIQDPVEGIASIVNVTFPQVKVNQTTTKIATYIHPMYDPVTYANNIAIIKLARAMVPDGKTLAVATYSTNQTADLYLNYQLRICGFGSIANYWTLPKTMQCTNLFVQPAANCSMVANTICTAWNDRDNNACNNDYGGPLYAYSYSGNNITQQVVGLASFSPNYRPNAPCFDGHKVVHMQTSFYVDWITNTTATALALPTI